MVCILALYFGRCLGQCGLSGCRPQCNLTPVVHHGGVHRLTVGVVYLAGFFLVLQSVVCGALWQCLPVVVWGSVAWLIHWVVDGIVVAVCHSEICLVASVVYRAVCGLFYKLEVGSGL